MLKNSFLPLSQLHVLIAGGVQLGLLFFSMILIVGIARKLTCLIIPWLVVYGLTQVAILASVIICVIYLPGYFKVSWIMKEALAKVSMPASNKVKSEELPP